MRHDVTQRRETPWLCAAFDRGSSASECPRLTGPQSRIHTVRGAQGTVGLMGLGEEFPVQPGRQRLIRIS